MLDRIYKIKELEGKIEFYKIVSNTLERNIRLIDSSMDKLLANALLYSYVENEKDLQKAFLKSNHGNDEVFLRKKLIDFLYGICF
ncbi:Type II site-specific deoxyribonuclease, partial [Candidatus Arthromitus sp. SFB-3]